MTVFSSFFGYAIRQPVAALDATNPVSVYRAEMTRNNLGHMLDESCQHLIGWAAVDDTDSVPLEVDDNIGTVIWSQDFPLRWLRSDRPVNLDLLVGCSATGTQQIRARVVPAKFIRGDASADRLALIDTTVGLTTGASSFVIDVQTDFGSDGIPKGFGGSAWDSSLLVSEGEITQVTISRMRLELIFGLGPLEEGQPTGKLTNVQLREFAG